MARLPGTQASVGLSAKGRGSPLGAWTCWSERHGGLKERQVTASQKEPWPPDQKVRVLMCHLQAG